MTDMELEKASEKHIEFIIERDREKAVTGGDPKVLRDRYMKCIGSGPSYVAWSNGTFLGCAGIVIYWPGVGEAWMAITPKGMEYLGTKEGFKDAIETIKTAFMKIAVEHDLRRVHAFVPSEDAPAVRWAEGFGLQREGFHRKYMPDGRDCYSLAWIREE
jgi:hypothetical protein